MIERDQITADYQQLLAGRGAICPFASRIEVRGRDRQTWLHNMCTAPIRTMTDGMATEAFITNVKGHVLAHVLIMAAADRLLIFAINGELPSLLPHFERYIIREDVQLSDASRRPGPWLVTKATGAELVDAAVPVPVPTFHPSLVLFDELDANHANSMSELSTELGEALRVAAGWPVLGRDFASNALPQELSRDHEAISFNKGCYLGQETVARLDALGHVNKQLVRIEAAGEPPATLPYEFVVGDKQAGQLTSVAPRQDADGWCGLAMVRREFKDATFF